jgi:hypothetical protein
MYFYVDESGHTGANLFDLSQPMLYYGVLSSKVNLDILTKPCLVKLRDKLGVNKLHAVELGNEGLAKIVTELLKLQKKYGLRFDLYRINKSDHAVISFFDQVFDSGVNLAVTGIHYWTPMRYVFLLKLASLFDKDIRQKAWAARIKINDKVAEAELIEICEALKARVCRLPDQRSQQVIGDALHWAKNNPEKIHYNIKCKEDLLSITPNVIGFQFVMHGIALHALKQKKQASKIVIDQQIQFNKSQKKLSEIYADNRNTLLKTGVGLPDINFKGMPTVPISFSSSTDSPGLELVDIFLWIFKRQLEGKNLERELLPIIHSQIHRGRTDELSIEAIGVRWQKWFDGLTELKED